MVQGMGAMVNRFLSSAIESGCRDSRRWNVCKTLVDDLRKSNRLCCGDKCISSIGHLDEIMT